MVCNYPPVQGMQKNVFFFTHIHQEDGEADSVSKYNMFEVRFIDVFHICSNEIFTLGGDDT
jgi:hypothetical protein